MKGRWVKTASAASPCLVSKSVLPKAPRGAALPVRFLGADPRPAPPEAEAVVDAEKAYRPLMGIFRVDRVLAHWTPGIYTRFRSPEERLMGLYQETCQKVRRATTQRMTELDALSVGIAFQEQNLAYHRQERDRHAQALVGLPQDMVRCEVRFHESQCQEHERILAEIRPHWARRKGQYRTHLLALTQMLRELETAFAQWTGKRFLNPFDEAKKKALAED